MKVNISESLTDKINIVNSIETFLKNDNRVASAWLFGSFARGEQKVDSDIDLMVEMNNNKKYSMFDILDISFLLSNIIKRKIDLVEKDCLQDFAMAKAKNDLIKIYG